jgi:cytochrome c553
MRVRPRLIMAAIFFGVGSMAAAQNWESAADIDLLEARLTDRETLFDATVREPPTGRQLELGRLVAMGGAEQGGAAMACFTCHGADGAGDGSGAFPRLAGLPAWYLYKQLQDYASGTRPNDIMSGIAQRLSEAEKEAVASYYAVVEAPYPDREPVPGDVLQWGGQLAAVGSVDKGIPACFNCHGPYGAGLPPSVPALAGQWAQYIAWQLHLWKAGTRDNDVMNVMAAIADKMDEADMRAVGAYFQNVRPLDAEASPVPPVGVTDAAPVAPPDERPEAR